MLYFFNVRLEVRKAVFILDFGENGVFNELIEVCNPVATRSDGFWL